MRSSSATWPPRETTRYSWAEGLKIVGVVAGIVGLAVMLCLWAVHFCMRIHSYIPLYNYSLVWEYLGLL